MTHATEQFRKCLSGEGDAESDSSPKNGLDCAKISSDCLKKAFIDNSTAIISQGAFRGAAVQGIGDGKITTMMTLRFFLSTRSIVMRYRFRSMFLSIAIVAAAFACLARLSYHRRVESLALDRLTRPNRASHVTALLDTALPNSIERILCYCGFVGSDYVKHLRLSSNVFTDADIEAICEFYNLSRLDLYGTGITRAGVDRLGEDCSADVIIVIENQEAISESQVDFVDDPFG